MFLSLCDSWPWARMPMQTVVDPWRITIYRVSSCAFFGAVKPNVGVEGNVR